MLPRQLQQPEYKLPLGYHSKLWTLTNSACKFKWQQFKWQLCKRQKLLSYHRSQWYYSQEKCYWRQQQNWAKGGGDTHKKVQPCNSWVPGKGFSFPRKHHFFFDYFLSWISTINKSQCWGKTLRVRKPGSSGCQETPSYKQPWSCAFQLFYFRQLKKKKKRK